MIGQSFGLTGSSTKGVLGVHTYSTSGKNPSSQLSDAEGFSYGLLIYY